MNVIQKALQQSLYPNYEVTYLVGQEAKGMRLDQFLKRRYPARSREELKRVIKSKRVNIHRLSQSRLQTGSIKPSLQLLLGDEVLVYTQKRPEPPVDFGYCVLYEDDVLWVIDKPPFLPVHPAGRYFFNTLWLHLKSQFKDQSFYLVHRIDQETSGVLVLAKTKKACAHLTQQFANRAIQKCYLAIVYGITPKNFYANFPLCRSTTSKIRLKMQAILPTRKPKSKTAALQPVSVSFSENTLEPLTPLSAYTHFERLGYGEGYSLVKCFPKTGRQHQIRVHLDALGYPLVGDKLYGRNEDEALEYFENPELRMLSDVTSNALNRHALHAFSMTLSHPNTLKPISFEAHPPKDFQDFVSRHIQLDTDHFP